MKETQTLRGGLFAAAILSVTPAFATLISVSGPNSSLGTAPQIIPAPNQVLNSTVFNTGQQGFNEKQGVLLGAPLNHDYGVIPANTLVDSHMIFLNREDGLSGVNHLNVRWTFSGSILGVMSDGTGALEVASSSFLGAAGTTYPAAPFNARGLENNDSYTVSGNTLTFSSRVTQPGDWIRVITAVPDVTSTGCLTLGLMGLVAARRRFLGA